MAGTAAGRDPAAEESGGGAGGRRGGPGRAYLFRLEEGRYPVAGERLPELG